MKKDRMDSGPFPLRELGLLVALECLANLAYLRAVDADGFMQLLAGDVKLLCPIVDVGGELGIDLVWIVRSLSRGNLSFDGDNIGQI